MEVDERLLSELKGEKEKTKYLMQTYPNTRDNDFYLALMYLKVFGKLSVKIPFIPWNEITAVGSKLDGTVRMRRKIQNEDGLLLPLNPEILRKRQAKAKKYRKTITRV